jgi:galactose oxidase
MKGHLLRRGSSHGVRLLAAAIGLAVVFSLSLVAFAAAAHRGAAAPAAPRSAPAASKGEWSPVMNFDPAVVAIHAHLLPSGKVLMWERYPTVPEEQWINTYLWDPAGSPSGKLKTIKNPFANVFCSGHTFLSDGRLFVAGGHDRYDGYGTKTLLFFDYRTEQWTQGPNMNKGRWYPTTAALTTGEVLAISGEAQGDVEAPSFNDLPQVWTGPAGWRDLGNARRRMSLYPWMLLAPDGQVFWAGPESPTAYLNTSGGGTWTAGPDRRDLYRDYGSAVEYEPGRVLVLGGGDPPTETAKKINLNATPPAWEPAGSMKFARRQQNATLLPDGTVLVTGGTSSRGFNNGAAAVRAAELWDPRTGRWTELAAMSPEVKRLYHSTALLLPDGRVLSAGGGLPSADGDDGRKYPNAQLFSPPYLFAGPRPTIASAPDTLKYHAGFSLKTPDVRAIEKVTLLRLGSVTHAFDQSQRFVQLEATAVQDGLNVVAPASSKISPPGPYMLFILNRAGVPSVAKIVHLGE